MALRVDDVDLVRDRALVERFQLGDPAAFETLYRRYFARLVRFCQKRVGDHHEAEEIAQEAFTKALRAMPTFEGERRFYPWMTVIAGRLCVDAHRRRGRTEPSAVIDLGVIEGGQERIVDAVDVEILATALGRLATRHREVLDLREQQGWSYQQIADHYDVTLGTVEALLFRARKALKREFLAVVGDERHWAAVPVFGLVLRRLASWKARLDAALPALPSLAGPVVAGVLAVTAVSGVVGIGLVHDWPGSAARRTVVVRPSTTLDLAAESSVAERAGANSDATSIGTGPGSPAAPAATLAVPPQGTGDEGATAFAAPRADTPVIDSVGTDGADDPKPVQGEIVGVFVGIDPEAAAAQTVARIDGYRKETNPGVLP